MNSFYKEFKDLSQKGLNDALMVACSTGEIDKVKYLLTSHDLTLHADSHAQEGSALINACRNNHYELIQYLLYSSELEQNISIHTANDCIIIQACEDGNVELAKYLLTSPNILERPNIHTKGNQIRKDRPFLMAYICERMEMLNYLIFDYKIEKTEAIEEILNDNFYNIADTVRNMFKVRELNEKLEKDLSCGEEKIRKPKI